MQIILMEKVANLGQLGEVVKVKDGYARNFLLPTGKAKRANTANLAEFEARRAEFEAQQAALLAEATANAAKIEGGKFSISQKAGVDGRLFGSVTTADLAEAIASNLGVTVKKADIRLPDGPFKMIGEYAVTVALHHDVLATVAVTVVPAAN